MRIYMCCADIRPALRLAARYSPDRGAGYQESTITLKRLLCNSDIEQRYGDYDLILGANRCLSWRRP